MNNAAKETARLGLVLAKDKMRNATRFNSILKLETQQFLKSFFELEEETLSISVCVQEDGKFDFVIKGRATRLVPCTNI